MNIFVTVLTLAAVFASTEAGPQGRITHGHLAREREFSFMVGIFEFDVHLCGGVIISNYWVITAAHCVEERREVSLSIGSTNAFFPELLLTVPGDKITVHPGYIRRMSNDDIALLNTTYIEFTSKINKVLLPTMRDESDLAGYLVTAIGWGQDHNRERDEENLRFTIMRAMTAEECEFVLRFNQIRRETTLCAMPYIGSTCFHDSGGPVVISKYNILVGIIGFVGSPRCPRGYPVGFARVTQYRDWIKNVSGVYRP